MELQKLLLVGGPNRTNTLKEVIEASHERVDIKTAHEIFIEDRKVSKRFRSLSDKEFILFLLAGYFPSDTGLVWVPNIAVVPAETFDNLEVSFRYPVILDCGTTVRHYERSPNANPSDPALYALYGTVSNAIQSLIPSFGDATD